MEVVFHKLGKRTGIVSQGVLLRVVAGINATKFVRNRNFEI
jgi:hypothetical protein